MKKTQIIEALRNIKKQKVSYISIVLITMCAVTAFLGVSFGSYSLAMGGSEFYDRQNFRDLEIVSAVMFSDSDLQKIAAVEGVSDVEGQMRTNAKLTAGGTKTGVNVLSKTERINLPLIKEGSMPSAPGECAVESGLASDLGLNIGDTIILDESENTISLLTGDAFKITAIVDHPDHLVVPNTYTNYVIVPFESFDSELLQGRKILAEVVIDKPEGINRLDKKYTKLIAPVSERLEALSAECAAEALSDMWQTKEEYIVQLKESYIKPALSGIIERYTDRTLEEAEQYVDSLNWSTPDFVPDLNDKDLDARVIQILSDVSVKLTDLEGLIGSLKELAGELVIPGADGDDTSSVLKQTRSHHR